MLRRGDSRRPGNAPGCTDAPRRGDATEADRKRLDGPRRSCAAGPGVARLREPVPPWRKGSRGLGVARSRVAGRPAWRYPACRTRLSIGVGTRKSQWPRHRGKTINVAFGLSQQCGSGCLLRHRIAHYNLPSEPCGCAPALAASARASIVGACGCVAAWPQETARAVKTPWRWPASTRSPLPKRRRPCTFAASSSLEHLPTVRRNQDTAPSRIKRLDGGETGTAVVRKVSRDARWRHSSHSYLWYELGYDPHKMLF